MTEAKHRYQCTHCFLPVTEDLKPDVFGNRFCCSGCATAWDLINNAGLCDYYSDRQWDKAGVPEGVYLSKYNDETLQRYVQDLPDRQQILLLIDAIHCPSCVWVIEKILLQTPGVIMARLNHGSHLLTVQFDGTSIGPAAIMGQVNALGYPAHPWTRNSAAEQEARTHKDLVLRFGTSAFFSVQVMAFSFALYGGYFHGIDTEIRNILQWFTAIACTPVVLYGGWPFFTGAWRALRNASPDMDLLVATGAGSAYLYSVIALIVQRDVYFDSAAMIISFLLLGKLLEAGAQNKATDGIRRLLELIPDQADRLMDGKFVLVPAEDLEVDDLIMVRPGSRFPADGIVIEGTSDVNQSAVTGEPAAVSVQLGDPVLSGTGNLSSSLQVRVTKVGTNSFVGSMIQLVQQAQQQKPELQRFADRVSGIFVPAVLLLSLLTLAGWYMQTGDLERSLFTAITVLVVACPCALGLATPTALIAAMGNAASRGILIRDARILETLSRVTYVFFDKTGTLTSGKPTPVLIQTATGITEDKILTVAASAEVGSLHPLAIAILVEAEHRGLPIRPLSSTVLPGFGVIADSGEGTILAGNRRLMAEHKIDLGSIDLAREDTGMETLVALDGLLLGRILFDDKPRPESPALVKFLRDSNIQTHLITGDRQPNASAVSEFAGIPFWEAELHPTAKADLIDKYNRDHAITLMVGDGINDAVALQTANIGCSIAGSTDLALETAQLVLLRPDLQLLATALQISHKTRRIVIQNLSWAFLYNGVALALATSGELAPIHAAAAMASSSVLVVLNSLRLTRTPKS